MGFEGIIWRCGCGEASSYCSRVWELLVKEWMAKEENCVGRNDRMSRRCKCSIGFRSPVNEKLNEFAGIREVKKSDFVKNL